MRPAVKMRDVARRCGDVGIACLAVALAVALAIPSDAARVERTPDFRVAVFGAGNLNFSHGGVAPYVALGYAGCTRALTEAGLPASNCVYFSLPLTITIEDFRPAIVSGLFRHYITLGFQFAASATEAALAYPNTTWTLVDSPVPPGVTNVQGVLFSEDEAGFLAGVTAGLFSSNGVLGVIAGLPFAAVKKLSNGFYLGARSTCPSCVIHIQYVPSFVDEDIARNATARMISLGVEIIFGVGGHMSSTAIFDAAGHGVYVIGVDTDEKLTTFANQSDPRAQFLITSAEKRVDIGVYFSLREVVAGSPFKAVDRLVDAAVGGVQVSPCSSTTTCNRLLQPTSVSEVDSTTGCLQTVSKPRREIVDEYVSRLASRNILSGVDSHGDFVSLKRATDETWVTLPAYGQPPRRLSGHTAVDAGADSILVFGGEDAATGNSLSSTYLLDVDMPTWKPFNTTGPLPPARKYHCAVAHNGRMYVFGGTKTVSGVDPVVLGDTWRVSLTPGGPWTQVSSMGTPRDSHACARVGGAVFVYGGRTQSGELLSDLLRFNLDTEAWDTVAISSVARPPPLLGAVLVAVNGTHVILHGGKGVTAASDAAWIFSLSQGVWVQLSPTLRLGAVAAPELYRHTAILLDSERILFTGGVGEAGASAASYLYSASRNAWLPTARTLSLSQPLQSFAVVRVRQADYAQACVYPDTAAFLVVDVCTPDPRPMVVLVGGVGGAASSPYAETKVFFVGNYSSPPDAAVVYVVPACDLLEQEGRGILRGLSRAVHANKGGVAFLIIVAIFVSAEFNLMPPYVLYRLRQLGYTHYGARVVENKRAFMRPSLINWLQVGMIVIEGVQIVQLVLAAQIDYGLAATLWRITSAGGLNFSFEWYYWLMFCGAFVWTTYAVCVLTHADIAISRNAIGRVLMFPSTYLLPVLSTIGYMPILSTLLASYRCSYIDAGGFMETEGMCTTPCWSGIHWAYAVCSLVALIFWPLALYTAPLWQDLLDNLDIRYTRTFFVLESWVKIAMVVSRVFLWNVPWAHLAIMFVLTLGTFTYILRFRPCGLDWVNHLRAIAFALGAFTAVVVMGREAEGDNGEGVWLVIVLPCGWISLVVGGIVYISLKYKVMIRDEEDMHARRTTRLRDLLETINDYSALTVTPKRTTPRRPTSNILSGGHPEAHASDTGASAQATLAEAKAPHHKRSMTLLSPAGRQEEATPSSLLSKFLSEGILTPGDEKFLQGLVSAENQAVLGLFRLARGDETVYLENIASMLIAMLAYRDYSGTGSHSLASASVRSAVDSYRISVGSLPKEVETIRNLPTLSAQQEERPEERWDVAADGQEIATVTLPHTVEEAP